MHRSVNFDAFLEKIGGFGRFQKRAITSLFLSQCFLAFSNFGFVFFGHVPEKFHCVNPDGSNRSIAQSGCVPGCSEYVSDDGYSSYAVDWGLVCSHTYMLRLSQVMHMAGLFIGAPSCGKLADMYGRLKILYINLAMLSILSFAVAFAPGIYAFCLLTFLQGIACQGCGLTSYTVILESFGAKYRALGGILEQIFYAVGIATTALLAYYLSNWRHLAALLAAFGPLSLILMLPFHIESPRWLLTKPHRRQDALINLAYMARVNGHLDGLSSPDAISRLNSLLDSESSSEISRHPSRRSSISQGSQSASDDSDSTPLVGASCDAVPSHIANEGTLTLLRHPLLRWWTLIFCLCCRWIADVVVGELRSLYILLSQFSNASAYYGSTIGSGEAFKDRFLSFGLSGLVEVPGHCLSPWLMNKYLKDLMPLPFVVASQEDVLIKRLNDMKAKLIAGITIIVNATTFTTSRTISTTDTDMVQ
ncbi:unnamed protein product [Schistocephalus solidus]|uniref:MFS domain-containing protein n=1 Tax=Schistocephalus solidus TaxID=70667 RepID=A0A183T7U0_SCHSO|nr:unnamed protein product [Schistocephalus solidus]